MDQPGSLNVVLVRLYRGQHLVPYFVVVLNCGLHRRDILPFVDCPCEGCRIRTETLSLN
jgi:hypothetical protein